MVDLPWMGDGRTTLTRDDIRYGVRMMQNAMLLLLLVLLPLSFV